MPASSQPPRRVVTPNTQPHQRPHPHPHPQPVDIRQTKEYKAATRRWISTIVALPILMYTSYELYNRTFGTKKTQRPESDQGPQ